MKKTISFCTHVSDNWFESIGTLKLLKSAKRFHPNIPFYIFGDTVINKIFASHSEFNWCTIHPVISYQLIDMYDMVVHFDADCIIAAPLTEIFENIEYDLLYVRNNNDYDKAGMDRPICDVAGMDITQYANAGFSAISNKQFLEDWININITEGNQCDFKENTTLNKLIATGKYKCKMLDPKESNVYYGLSALSGTKTHWDSWKDIAIDNGLKLNNKTVKILHQAGGSTPEKLKPEMFNQPTLDYLNDVFDDYQVILKTIDNEHFIIKDSEIFDHFYNGRTYAKHICKITYNDRFLDSIPKGNLMVDIGANVGIVSIYLSPRFNTVCSIEPTPAHYDKLCKIINGIDVCNILPINKAVYDIDDIEINFNIGEYNSTTNSICNWHEHQSSIQVKTISLARLIDIYGDIDFLKIDCEGGEEYIILTDIDFNENAKHIKSIYLEIHDMNGKTYDENRNLYAAALTTAGYKIDFLNSISKIYATK